MMSKGEIAAYLGMANVMMSSVKDDDDDTNNIMQNVKQALLEAQIYMTQEALREALAANGQSED